MKKASRKIASREKHDYLKLFKNIKRLNKTKGVQAAYLSLAASPLVAYYD